jgi:transcriptional regulator with XRE-family HTH domain
MSSTKDPAAEGLGPLLRRLRGIKGAKLREVETETGVSNAYLSQLENGSTANPSAQVLHKLSGYYGVPYEALMEAAGHVQRATTARPDRRLGAIEVALMSAKLTDDEQAKVAEFVEFLRSQRRKK